MLPFTKEEVQAAYKATGLKPMHGDWMSADEHMACPLSAICVKRFGKSTLKEIIASADWYWKDRSITRAIAEKLGMSAGAAFSFWRGVDGRLFQKTSVDGLPGSEEAFDLGRELRVWIDTQQAEAAAKS